MVARDLGRSGEVVRTITLGALTPDAADMRTLIVVGSSRTRRFSVGGRAWVYTPRGDPAKWSDEA